MNPETIRDGVKRALSLFDKGDVIASYSESCPVSIEMDHLKSIEDYNRFGIGARVFQKDRSGVERVGNSSVNSLDALPTLKKNAFESAALGDIQSVELPCPASYAEPGLYDPATLQITKEDMIKTAQDLVHKLKSIDSRANADVSVSRSESVQFLANTSGFAGDYRETGYGVSASLLLVEDGGGLLNVGDGDSSHTPVLDLDTVLSNIEWRYKHARKTASIDTGYYPVLFVPDALDLLLEAIEIAANGKTLYKGISVLSGRENEKICAKGISIFDDPFYKGGTDCYPFDDEGIVPARMPIIEEGVFKNFITDLVTSSRLNRRPTGHGRRGLSSLPAPGFSNLVMAPGSVPFNDMVASIKKGLIVCSFLGGGMSNILAGDFSVNIELGYLVENGRVKGRVKDVMLSGNAYDVLSNVLAVENKLHKVGSLFAPRILFERVSVAG